MAHFTVACVVHNEIDLLARTFPRAVHALTSATRHTVDTVIVAERASVSDAAKLVELSAEWGVTELRWRRPGPADFLGAPVNNFHTRQFNPTDDYLVTFTHDTFFHLEDPGFDVLDAAVGVFDSIKDAAVICKVDDHEEWTRPLQYGQSWGELGVEVDRAVDQFLIYDNRTFLPAIAPSHPWRRDRYGVDEEDYAWEDVITSALAESGTRIVRPESWPLVVKHTDLRLDPDSMHGTQMSEVKARTFDALAASGGRHKEPELLRPTRVAEDAGAELGRS